MGSDTLPEMEHVTEIHCPARQDAIPRPDPPQDHRETCTLELQTEIIVGEDPSPGSESGEDLVKLRHHPLRNFRLADHDVRVEDVLAMEHVPFPELQGPTQGFLLEAPGKELLGKRLPTLGRRRGCLMRAVVTGDRDPVLLLLRGGIAVEGRASQRGSSGAVCPEILRRTPSALGVGVPAFFGSPAYRELLSGAETGRS